MDTHDRQEPSGDETTPTANNEEQRQREEPQVFAICRAGSGWGVSRRQFVGTAMAGASVLAGCSDTPSKSNEAVTAPASPAPSDDPDIDVEPVAHTDDIVHITFVPASNLLVSASDDNTVKLWSMPGGNLLKTLLGHKNSVRRIAVSPNGRFLVSLDSDETARIWSLPDGNTIETIDDVGKVDGLYVTNSGQQLLTRTAREVRVRDFGGALPERKYSAPAYNLHVFAEGPDDLYSVSVTLDNRTVIHSISDGSKIAKIEDTPASHIAASLDGTLLGLACSDRTVRVYSLPHGVLQQSVEEDGELTGIQFCGNKTLETLVRTSSSVRAARTYRVSVGWTLVREIKAHDDTIYDLAVSQNGRHAATVSKDRSIKVWDLADWQTVREIKDQPDAVFSVAFTPDGDYFLTGGRDGKVNLWSISPDTSARATCDGHPGGVTQIETQEDKIWTCGRDHSVKAWECQGDSSQFREAKSFAGGSTPICALAVSDRFVAIGGTNGRLRLSAIGGEAIADWEGHTGAIYALEASRVGDLLASGGDDHSVRVWECETHTLVSALEGHSDAVYSIAIADEQGWIASCGKDGSVRIWDLSSGSEQEAFETGATQLDVVFLSKDSMAASGVDGRIRIWSSPKIEQVDSVDIPDDYLAGEHRFAIVQTHKTVIVAREKRLVVNSLDSGKRLKVMSDIVATRTETERVKQEERTKAIAEAKRKREQKARETTVSKPTYSRPSYSPPSYSPPSYSYGGHYWRPN